MIPPVYDELPPPKWEVTVTPPGGLPPGEFEMPVIPPVFVELPPPKLETRRRPWWCICVPITLLVFILIAVIIVFIPVEPPEKDPEPPCPDDTYPIESVPGLCCPTDDILFDGQCCPAGTLKIHNGECCTNEVDCPEVVPEPPCECQLGETLLGRVDGKFECCAANFTPFGGKCCPEGTTGLVDGECAIPPGCPEG